MVKKICGAVGAAGMGFSQAREMDGAGGNRPQKPAINLKFSDVLIQFSTMAFDPSLSVLVVDDYATMVRIIRNLLRQLGFVDIDDASDGASGLTMMRHKRYGLVISDWNMEPMTGFEFLREVRSDPALSETPFIMVTAESKTENVIAARKAGVNNYIVKPFNAQTLKAKIEAVFATANEPTAA